LLLPFVLDEDEVQIDAGFHCRLSCAVRTC
jgi:hypothetical protein